MIEHTLFWDCAAIHDASADSDASMDFDVSVDYGRVIMLAYPFNY
jgi:hypothetical protein